MKIGIIGTRGIPNQHGGFEQFAEYFSVFLAKQGHEVVVYSSSNHSYQKPTYQNVRIVHAFDPENRIGTAGQFVYDLNCILNARKQQFDIILQLGYTSSSVWGKLLPKNALVLTNMDGLEWKRTKYNPLVRRFLKAAEKMAVQTSDFLIADSLGIQQYLQKKYNTGSKYIAYGAHVFNSPNVDILEQYQIEPYAYNMLIARMEPENNIETILDGVAAAESPLPFLVIGKHEVNSFGKYLKKKFADCPKIRFLGGVYHTKHLDNLRHFSNLYFHGHSVGGTNPSLLEAMASNALIVAHENPFNRSILEENAFYFQTASEVKKALDTLKKQAHFATLEKNSTKIEQHFDWKKINQEYLDFMITVHGKN